MGIINWIHLSDFHIRSTGQTVENYNSDVVLEKLLEDIGKRTEIIDQGLKEIDFVFISGDLVWSGNDSIDGDEYEQAFFRIIEPLMGCTETTINQIYIVPGNHDVERSKVSEDTRNYIKKIKHPDEIVALLRQDEKRLKKEEIYSRLSNYNKMIEARFSHIPIDPISSGFKVSVNSTTNSLPVNIIGVVNQRNGTLFKSNTLA